MEQIFLAIYLPIWLLKQGVKDCYPLEGIERLAVRLKYFTPQVSIDSELLLAAKEGRMHTISPLFTGLLLNMTGTARAHQVKDLTSLPFYEVAERIYSRLLSRDIEAQIGVAPTPRAAWALSRYGTSKKEWFAAITKKKKIREQIGPFPLKALRLEENQIALLEELGVYTLEALLSLPRKQLGTRFGVSLLKAIDELLGDVDPPLSSFYEQEALIQEAIFDPPLYTQKVVIRACVTLFQKILQEVQLRHLKAERFLLSLTSKSPEGRLSLYNKELSLHSSTSDTSSIERIISPSIQSMTFSGEVHEVRIVLEKGVRTSPVQLETTNPLPALSPTKEREFLNALLFQKKHEVKICRVFFKESYIPEKSFFFKELLPGEAPSFQDNIGFLPYFSYPSHLLEEPKKIEALALLPDHPPARISLKGKPYRIITGFGPERISEEWWQKEYFQEVGEREYFRLLDETGRWLWVFRKQVRSPHRQKGFLWYLHGIWL